MKNTESILNDGRAQWNKVKMEMDNFNVQLALGRNEAKDAFEREWKKFSVFIDEQTNRLRRQSNWASHRLDELEQRSRALKANIKQAMPDTEKSYQNWREATLRIIYELEFIIDEIYPVLETEEKDLLSAFRIKMEVYRTRLLILPLAELSTLAVQAAQLAEKAEDVLIWRDRDAEASREKIQKFGKEISTSFDHMKQAFSGLFK